VICIDTLSHTLELCDGTSLGYGRVVIAPMDMAVLPPVGRTLDPSSTRRVFNMRHRRSRELFDSALKKGVKRVTVVGGGWAGCELATELAEQGLEVTMVYGESAPLARYLPSQFAVKMASKLSKLDISVYNYAQLQYVMGGKRAPQVQVRKTYDRYAVASFYTDVIVFAPTRTPGDTSLVVGLNSGLEMDTYNKGIVVNTELQAVKDVYCAGSSISYPCRSLQRCNPDPDSDSHPNSNDCSYGRRTSQSTDHSIRTGVIAGANATGAQLRYKELPVFRSGALGNGVVSELVGDVNSGYENYTYSTRTKSNEGQKTSVIFYLKEDHVVGAVCIGCPPAAVEIAKRWVIVGQPEGMAERIMEQVRNQGKRTEPIADLLALDAPRMLFEEGVPAAKVIQSWQPSMGKEAWDRKSPEKESDGAPDSGKGNFKTRRDYYSDAIQSGIRSIGNKDLDASRELTKKERYDHMAIRRVPKSSDGVNTANLGDSGLNNLR